jgi:hypothetical protein
MGTVVFGVKPEIEPVICAGKTVVKRFPASNGSNFFILPNGLTDQLSLFFAHNFSLKKKLC